MSDYLTAEQYQILMHPAGIHKDRVLARDGMAYVEVHDIKAMMIRVYGFDRFSWELRDIAVLFEQQVKSKAGKDIWHVGYRVHGVLSVCAPDGTHLADYSGAHSGASFHPDLGEAHGNALTNADSYAFKRAALFPLATQGGLGLYNKGSRAEIVRWTAVHPDLPEKDGEQTEKDPSNLPPVAAESLSADPADEPRTTTAPPVETPEKAEQIRAALLAGPGGLDPRKWLQDLTREAGQAKVLGAKVEDANGKQVALKVLLETEFKFRTAA